MSRLRSEDDLALLIQANHERPFLQHLPVMKSWRCNLLKVPGFSRQECEVDGKEKFQKESVYLYGVDRRYECEQKFARQAGIAKRERLTTMTSTSTDSIIAK
ncbi:hypothetical protein DYB35_013490 [Aphanomyces astaci]|uniref:Uncharacterized protein n=1 Tax=Aphanomyces astaci TaxID=112090 RepID=A0A3R7A1T9_APHAT|nr:hypothetical protein DYB35_013490 [Aphanomyces astaci]RQM16185.1 hypothetical protein B5M09_010870 [Aphanomyces astaci]